MVLDRNCLNVSGPLHNMAAQLKIEKVLNDIFSEIDDQILIRLNINVPWVVLNQNLSNGSIPLHNMAAKTKKWKNL